MVSQPPRWNTAPMAGNPHKAAMSTQVPVILSRSVEREKVGVGGEELAKHH